MAHCQNGLLVRPGDSEALADAIRLLGHDATLRDQLQRGARATAEGELDWSRIAACLTAALAQLTDIAAIHGLLGTHLGSYS